MSQKCTKYVHQMNKLCFEHKEGRGLTLNEFNKLKNMYLIRRSHWKQNLFFPRNTENKAHKRTKQIFLTVRNSSRCFILSSESVDSVIVMKPARFRETLMQAAPSLLLSLELCYRHVGLRQAAIANVCDSAVIHPSEWHLLCVLE